MYNFGYSLLGIALALLAAGCSPAAAPTAKEQFLKIARHGSGDHEEMHKALVAVFEKGSPESDYQDLLKTAHQKITDANLVARLGTSETRGADTVYIWNIADGSDGAAYYIFTGQKEGSPGMPRIIVDRFMPIFDK